jgi:hypothetical protein
MGKVIKRITPEFVSSLRENEIFVFGCRNSGRHWDGASAFALKNFGAVMGQREGLQGQSYAIPTIGGRIGIKEIRRSVEKFTLFATAHTELHFLVTAIGCGGGGWRPSQIAPLFRKASKLPNVSLPQEFWDRLKEPRTVTLSRQAHVLGTDAKTTIQWAWGDILHKWMELIPAKSLYHFLMKRKAYTHETSWKEYDLHEGLSWISCFMCFYPKSTWIRYVLNHNTRRAYVVVDDNRNIPIIRLQDIDWTSVSCLPDKVKEHIRKRKAEYSFGICKYEDGVAKVMWKVSPDGRYHYLDKFGNGPTTDEKEIELYGKIDTKCRFVEKLHTGIDHTENLFYD